MRKKPRLPRRRRNIPSAAAASDLHLVMSVARPSNHVEPRGTLQVARHYIRELIYGANDGIITTFAVVAGVAGGGLSPRVILICGVANLLADGLSMASGNYLSIRSHESVLEAQGLPEEEASPVRHGAATFVAFVTAGAVPLLPFAFPGVLTGQFALSIALSFLVLFGIGAARTFIGTSRWWAGGAEMLGLGAVVSAVAFASGALVARLLGS